jgi:hypothetical protein
MPFTTTLTLKRADKSRISVHAIRNWQELFTIGSLFAGLIGPSHGVSQFGPRGLSPDHGLDWPHGVV